MKISIQAPDIMIFRPTDFIIKSVTLMKDDMGGDVANLPLALPGAYDSTMPEQFPWDGYHEEVS